MHRIPTTRGCALLAGASSLALVLGSNAAYAQAAAPANAAAAQAPAPAAEASAAPDQAVAEVVVTGTRIRNPTYTAPTPVSVVSEIQLQQRAKPTLAETLNEMPAFHPTSGLGLTTRGTFGSGQAVLDLRGLGPIRTLVLVDGVRPVPTTTTGLFDTNMLPSQMISRVDTVTGGASAAYGSDAVAGVVNFILDRRINGVRADARWGVSQAGDGATYGVNLAAGHAFLNDKLHLEAGVDLAKGLDIGTQFNRSWGQTETDVLALSGPRAAGVPANLLINNAHQIAGANSTVLGCTTAAGALTTNCPVYGTTFTPAGVPIQQQFGSPIGAPTTGAALMSGGSNRGLSLSDVGMIQQAYARAAGLVSAEYEFDHHITADLDFMGGTFSVRSNSYRYGEFLSSSMKVNANNPYLPASLAAAMQSQGITQLTLSRAFEDVGGIEPRNTNAYWQLRGGLNGDLNVLGGWHWNVTGSHGSSRFEYETHNFVLPTALNEAVYAVTNSAGQIVCGPIATNPNILQGAAQTAILKAQLAAINYANCTPYNPFGSTNSAAALKFISSPSEALDTNTRDTAAANLSGNLVNLPAGPMSAAVGYEYHKDTVTRQVPADLAPLEAAGALWATNFLPASGQTAVHEVYGEVDAPILKDMTLAHALNLNGAVRWAHYSAFGGNTTWKVGTTYEPIDWFMLRALRSHDVRAPTLNDLYVPAPQGAGTATNPFTGINNNFIAQATANPNLKPENADTTTIGGVFQPKTGPVSGLRFSVDYWDITINQVIASLSTQQIVNRWAAGDPTAQNLVIATNNNTLITNVISPPLNLNSQKARGLDFALDYRLNLDRFHLPGTITTTNNLTRTYQLEQFDSTGHTLGQLAGAATGVPKWRGTSSFTYDLDKFSGTLTVRYFSDIRNDITKQGPTDAGYNPASSTSINQNLYPGAGYLSLNLSYKLTDALQVYGVVDNLADKNPPAGAWALSNPYYDYTGRYFRIGVRYRH